MTRPTVTRAQVLGFRAARQGLTTRPGDVDGVLALGLQDTPAGSAAAARWVRAGAARAEGEVVAWTWRGAPHLHRCQNLPALAAALWPVDDADATRRLGTGVIKEGARRGVEAFTLAATAMRDVVRDRMPKGEVSAAVTAAIPDDLSFDCRTCGARHISGGLFQQVGLAAGVEVVSEGGRTFLRPLPESARPSGVPESASGTAGAFLSYLRVLGPASPADLAAQLGAAASVARSRLPDGVVEVDGPAGTAILAEDDLGDLLAASAPRGVRLLAPGDPWLSARDRELIVPDVARRKEVWRAIGNPGVVLVDGEVVGTWRPKTAGRRLTVTVSWFSTPEFSTPEFSTPEFSTPDTAVSEAVEAEAHHVAAGRGAEDVRVVTT